MVGGGGTVELVGGTNVDDVGGWVVGGGSVVGGDVAGGLVAGGEVAGGEVAGGLVPVLRGAVVITGGVVVPVPPVGAGATVVVGSRGFVVDVDEEEVDEAFDVVVARMVVVGAGDDVGVWLATDCLGEVSSPATTSNRSAAKAMVART